MSFSEFRPSGTARLIEHFETFHPISAEMREMIELRCSPLSFRKGKYLVSPLDLKPSMYFIVSGSVRGFVKDHGEEITTWLCTEGSIVGLTLFEKKYSVPREQFIQALEFTEVVVIPHAFLLDLFNFTEMSTIARNMLWQHYHEADERNFLIRIPSAEKRIQRLIETYPNFYNRIPSKHLASFLGIREETLSRLKAKILRS